MSMSRCKCDKTFDTDEELNHDEKGECCCDECYLKDGEQFDEDLAAALNAVAWGKGCDTIGSIVEQLMDKGYRKVR